MKALYVMRTGLKFQDTNNTNAPVQRQEKLYVSAVKIHPVNTEVQRLHKDSSFISRDAL